MSEPTVTWTDATRPPTLDHLIARLTAAGWRLDRDTGRWIAPSGVAFTAVDAWLEVTR